LPVNIDLEPKHDWKCAEIAQNLNPVAHFENEGLAVLTVWEKVLAPITAEGLLEQKQGRLQRWKNEPDANDGCALPRDQGRVLNFSYLPNHEGQDTKEAKVDPVKTQDVYDNQHQVVISDQYISFSNLEKKRTEADGRVRHWDHGVHIRHPKSKEAQQNGRQYEI
jgi:hypothetical protein